MELSFETAEVREICEVREVAMTVLGDAAAKALAARLSDVEASRTFSDLQLLLDEQLELHADGTYTLRLSTGSLITGRAGGATVPKTSTGAVDWENVTRMRIVSIGALE